MEKQANKPSVLTLSDRALLDIDGVECVKAFDGEYVLIGMKDTDLTVYGEDLKIEDMSSAGGKIRIRGRIDSMIYGSERKKRWR